MLSSPPRAIVATALQHPTALMYANSEGLSAAVSTFARSRGRSMPLIELPRVIPDRPGRPEWGEAAAPMRELTRAIALEPGAWTPERANQITTLFDSLATAWRERDSSERHDALADAVARGGPFPRGGCLEIGSGTGNATGDLRATFHHVISVDLSREMLSRTSWEGCKIQGDAAHLPVRTSSVSVV